MRPGWVKKRLSDVTTKIGSGATPRGGNESYKAEGVSLIRSLNVYDDGFRKAKLARIDQEQANALLNVIVEPQDVLLNITGASVARCCRAPADLLPARVNQHVSIIRPDREILDSDFLHYLLISQEYKKRLLSTGEEGGSTRQAITKAQLQDFVIEFPESLPEQQRIVALLDEAFASLATAKANAEQNLQNASAAFERQLQLIINNRQKGWLETTLESCCEQIFAGGDVPKDRLSKVRTPEFCIPIFSNGEKDGGLYGFTDRARVTQPSITVSARGTLGFPALRTEPFLPVVRLIVLVPRADQISLSFLYYAVKAISFGNTGTSIPQLTVPNIKQSRILLPSLTEQAVIAKNLDSFSEEVLRLVHIYERKLAALEEIKKSLLHRAFCGEI